MQYVSQLFQTHGAGGNEDTGTLRIVHLANFIAPEVRVRRPQSVEATRV